MKRFCEELHINKLTNVIAYIKKTKTKIKIYRK